MYESSNELLKLTQNSPVRTKTHARIHVQYTPRVEQFWAVVPQRQKGRPGMGGTGAIHTSEVDEGAVCAAPAGQRSGVFVHRQRSGVLAFRQRWRAEVLLIQRDQHERTGSRWVRPSQRQREIVSTIHRRAMGVGANGQFEMLGGARRLGAGSIGSTQVRSRVDSEGCYKPQNRDAVRAPRGRGFAANGARRAG